MKLMLFSLALVAVIACANSAPLDELRQLLIKNGEYWGKLTISPDMREMLEAVHKYFPNTLALYYSPIHERNYIWAMMNLAELGKQGACDEVEKHNAAMPFDVECPPDVDGSVYLDMVFEVIKNNENEYTGAEAWLLCEMLVNDTVAKAYLSYHTTEES